ncbi:hypothetical protein JXB01_02920, partial [Candidatus Micrarchaeota archaeon]|nr:hypothetical protein [Candidatus Micrarchaeota archaeon]
MAEKKIKKVAIKKTTYSFDINRSYDYEKQFRIIEKTPLDEIKKKAKSLFAPSEKKLHPEKEKAKPGLNPLLIGGVLALLILLGTGLFIYFQLNAISSVPEKTEFPSSFFSASLQDGGMISYGSEEQNLHAGYLDIAYSLVSVQEPTLTLSVYGETPPSQVYILSNPRDYTQTNSFGDFKRTLKDILETKQMAASDITVEQLKTVQKGSLVIVPTGRLPKQMAEDGEQNIRRILERGAHIIYIGQDFTEVIDENGIVQQTPQTSLDKIGIIFKKTSPTAQGIELFRPGYTAEGKSSDYESSIILGALSVIKNTNSNGYLVIIPQTLDGGWREDGEKAGTEISKLVFQTPWIVPENIRQYQLEESNSSITKTFYTGPFSGSEKYIRADILGIDSEGYYTGKVIFKKVYPDSNGELYIDEGPALISSSVSGEK